MRDLELERQIITALEKLGDTADEVAENLYVMGYSGCMNVAENCPIARYISDRVPIQYFYVGSTGYSYAPSHRVITFDLPAISDFIIRFDNCSYPELIDASPSD